jgi:hypothetical protein
MRCTIVADFGKEGVVGAEQELAFKFEIAVGEGGEDVY